MPDSLLYFCLVCSDEGGLLNAIGWRGVEGSKKGRGGEVAGGGRRDKGTRKVLRAERKEKEMGKWGGEE